MRPASTARRYRSLPFGARVGVGFLAAYVLVAYVLVPQFDKVKSRRYPDLRDAAHLTHTGSGLPGDPLNIALAGQEEEVIAAFLAAGWRPAQALGWRSDLRIAADTVFNKPDPDAPVSHLYLYGRKEDMAFEKPIGHSPKERHHVRFWRSEQMDEGRPLWMGAATHDSGVELSRTTGEITHRISPDVDAERALLLDDLAKANQLLSTRWIDDFHQERQGRNGGGDPWHTDGRLAVATLAPGKSSRSNQPTQP